MTTAEKLELMEMIWADLSQDETNFASPPWHEQVLREREAAMREGREVPIDWETAKRKLRDLRA
ncbi:MAG: addiction module protein [Opitutaceae bacterium]|nr:addiction module protein [Opitutaceae bacterium]